MLKSVLQMNNLFITDYFIGLSDLVINMKKYTLQINSLQYNKEYNNVYNNLPPEYHDFADIFQAAEKQSLPERGLHNHAIDLKLKQQPLFRKLYSMFSAELNVLKVYLDDTIKAGIVHKSISSAASPIIFVLKSDSSLQLVINYRYLNNIIIKNHYSLLLISDMLNCL